MSLKQRTRHKACHETKVERAKSKVIIPQMGFKGKINRLRPQLRGILPYPIGLLILIWVYIPDGFFSVVVATTLLCLSNKTISLVLVSYPISYFEP